MGGSARNIYAPRRSHARESARSGKAAERTDRDRQGLAVLSAIFGIFLAVVGGTSCTAKQTSPGGLEVIVATDLETPQSFDTISVHISQQTASGGWNTLLNESRPVPAEVRLPAMYSIEAGSSPDQEALIQVIAIKDGVTLVERDVQLQVPTTRVAELPIVLSAVCVGVACPSGESCDPKSSACRTDIVVTSTLPTFEPGDQFKFDAGALVVIGPMGAKDAGPVDDAPTDAGPDASPDATVGSCTPGSLQCSGLQPQECGADGQWTSPGASCTYACALGACTGSCMPGTKQCDSDGLQTCGSDGNWATAVPCTNQACVGGACVGQCAPQSTECADGGVATCSASGAWAAATPCTSQACLGGQCSGSCSPSTTECSGNGVQQCDPNGMWGSVTACTNQACMGGECVGTCTPTNLQCNGLQPQKCDATGTWQANGATCPFVCGGGVCSGACTPSATQCSGLQPQKCDATGAWQANGAACPFVCGGGTCSGSCSPGTSECNGSQPEKCDATGSWQTNGAACAHVCSGGSCSGTCTPGALQCNGLQPQKCDSTGTWQSNGAACPYVCGGGTCSGSCTPGALQCSTLQPQKCDSTGTWQSNGAACPFVCSGGSCTGSCSPGSLQCTGQQPQQCSGAGAWVSNGAACSNQACVSGSCTGVCTPGSTICSGGTGQQTCTTSGAWGTTQQCAVTCLSNACQTVKAISTGLGSQTCALMSGGGVQCWGYNEEGEVGNGTAGANTATPGPVTNLSSGAKAVATGGNFSCALMTSGTVSCWGSNSLGQLGNGSTTGSDVPVQVSGLSGVTAITTGNTHACALLSNGSIDCWGENDYGAVGNGSTTGPQQCVSGSSATVCSTSPVQVQGITNAIAIGAGGNITCAVLANNTMDCWGLGALGTIGISETQNSATPVAISGLSGVTGLAVGLGTVCALVSGGTVDCWGSDYYAQLGNGTAAEVVASPAPVMNLTGAVAISAGYVGVCALLSNGTVDCWGDNSDGEIGTGSTTGPQQCPSGAGGFQCADQATAVSSLSGATAISTGSSTSCALLSGGNAVCWGYGGSGTLGNNTTTAAQTTPSAVVW